MKKIDLILAAILVPVDFLMMLLSAITAYSLRHSEFIRGLRPVIFNLPIKDFLIIILLTAPVWILLLAWFGLYTTRRFKFIDEISKIFQACSTGMMIITAYMFFIREIFTSRFILLFAWVFSIFFLIAGRVIIRLIKNNARSYGLGINYTVLIGKTKVSEILADVFSKKPFLGVKIIKIIDAGPGIIDELKKIKNIDDVIQTDYTLSRSVASQIIQYCQQNQITYKYVGGDFESKVTNNEVHTFAGVPIIEVKRTPLDGWGKILKRIIDIIFGTLFLILSLPIIIIFAIALKIESKGPIFADTPKRAGQYLKPFRMYKLRSMYVGAHKDQKKLKSERQGLFKMKDDPRITKIGRLIRKTSIDELPQFLNVITGKMSLVGPRPHFLNEYTAEQQKRVLDIKPGVTGLSQISGRSDLSFEEEIKLDSYYIENWSLWLDIWILLKTPIILFTKIKSAV